jgi:hypothetical protein
MQLSWQTDGWNLKLPPTRMVAARSQLNSSSVAQSDQLNLSESKLNSVTTCYNLKTRIICDIPPLKVVVSVVYIQLSISTMLTERHVGLN